VVSPEQRGPANRVDGISGVGSVAVSASLQKGVPGPDSVTGVACGREAQGDICMGTATERKWKESAIRH
jgi:hypothetical protein